MSRVSIYQVRLGKIVSGGHRSIDAYYLILKGQKLPVRYISRAMRIDEENEDKVTGEVEIQPSKLEVWNYDQMRLVETFLLDFKIQPKHLFSLYQQNMELTIVRTNSWEEELKKQYGNSEIDSQYSLKSSVNSDNMAEQNHSRRKSVSGRQKMEQSKQSKASSIRRMVEELNIPALPGKKDRVAMNSIGITGMVEDK